MDICIFKSSTKSLGQLFQYLGVVCISVPVTFLSRFLFAQIMTFGWSVVAANYLGMVIVFFLSRRYAFGIKQINTLMVFRFVAVAHIGLIVVWFVSFVMRFGLDSYSEYVSHMNLNDMIGLIGWLEWSGREVWIIDGFCHGIGIVSGFFVNFFGHKYFSFRREAISGN